ncbi:hypothetical protein [Arthrobacter sp. S41]|uniref:hypothetical protein n=1 Tax=Arthrobacter sp. S41 TaxID=2509721 RepID=UPI001035E133|nr:hypothetical protein [Arthrobacter sp. S41]TAP26826.1 hypothetical protein EYR88_00195 [Arthrobacter sp. S41]
MSNSLPGNPHAFAAADALRDTPVSVEEAYKHLAQATTQAALSVAFEIRTQTLLQANLHNRREATRMHGGNFEGMPEDVREMIREQGALIDERLGNEL